MRIKGENACESWSRKAVCRVRIIVIVKISTPHLLPLCVPAASQLLPAASLVSRPGLLSQCDQPELVKYSDVSRQEMTVPRHPTLSGVEQALDTPCVISSSDTKLGRTPSPMDCQARK